MAKTSLTFISFFGTKAMASPALLLVLAFFAQKYLDEEALFLSYGIVLN